MPSGSESGARIKEMTETELQEKLALEREEITQRVALFKATQEKFQRDREKYYAATMEAARAVRRTDSKASRR
jgi:outer membrane murein-binding lipoprotein Lpp